jgi:hypothetical protein
VKVAADVKLTATIPLGTAAGTYTLTLHNSVGTDTMSYAVAVKPGFDSFTPSHGPANATKTTNVHLTDAQERLRGVSAVLFNGKAGKNLSVSNDGESLTVDAPVGATTGKITVKNALGAALSATTFTVDAAPTITGFSVLTGKEGDPVTIVGTHLATATSVTFGGVEQDAVTPAGDGKSIATTVPTGAEIGKVAVDAPNGTAMSAKVFTPILVPSVDSISPANQALAGTALTITGANFTTATGVKIGNADAVFKVVSDTQLTTTVPAGAAGGSGHVTVTDPAGTGSTVYVIIVTPTITSFPAADCTCSGTTFTITGDFFNSVTGVTLNGAAVTYSVTDQQHIEVTPAISMTKGKLAVTNTAGTATSATDFTPVSITGGFSGSFAPGTLMTVSGVGLSAITSFFASGFAGTFSVNPGGTDTQVQFTVPSCGPIGDTVIGFHMAGGLDYAGVNFTYPGPACP